MTYTYHLQLSRGMYDIIRGPDGALMLSDLDLDQAVAVGQALLNGGADVVNLTYQTPPCLHCHADTVLTLPFRQYIAWRSGALIQNAFPDLSVDDREMIKTGTHPACWDAMFPHEESDDWGALVDEAYERETGK